MSLIDQIKDILLGGAANWLERLRANITLTSPEGSEFVAYWKADQQSVEKKLGIFSYPRIKGSIVQDMDVKSDTFTMRIQFEGIDNDLEARRFFVVARERGQWEITHPVFGFFGLQMVRATIINEPVDSGNITSIDVEWIEPIDPDTLLTARELAGIIDNQVKETNTNMLQQIADKIKQGTEFLSETIRSTVDKIGKITDLLLSPLNTVTDALTNLNRETQQALNDLQNNTVLDVQSLFGKVQQLIQNPAVSPVGFNELMDTYGLLKSDALDPGGLIPAFKELLPGGSQSSKTFGDDTAAAVNEVLSSEVALMAGLGAAGTIITTNDPASRGQAIDTARAIQDTFADITEALDATQEATADKTIDEQYFSNSQAYADNATLVGQMAQYLLIRAFDLSVEKRFTLKKPRSAIEITISEYGDLGDNDENLALFISSNNLKGDETLLLPAGREVLIYL